jgi:hypothetical protein
MQCTIQIPSEGMLQTTNCQSQCHTTARPATFVGPRMMFASELMEWLFV